MTDSALLMHHVLLVDDELDARELTLRAIRKSGFEVAVEQAAGGEDALRRLLEPTSTDAAMSLVLLDLNMPRVNGIEVLERLKEAAFSDRVPVVVLTGSDDPKTIVRAYLRGARGYVVKHVVFEEFCRDIKTTLTYWLHTVHLPPAPSTANETQDN